MPEVQVPLQVKVSLREHAVLKETRWGPVQKSLNQDFVFVNDKLAGYYSHVSKTFLPLAGWDNAMTPTVVDAIKKIKNEESVGATKAQPIELNATEQTEDDEDDN